MLIPSHSTPAVFTCTIRSSKSYVTLTTSLGQDDLLFCVLIEAFTKALISFFGLCRLLEVNKFTGPIPGTFGNLSALEIL